MNFVIVKDNSEKIVKRFHMKEFDEDYSLQEKVYDLYNLKGKDKHKIFCTCQEDKEIEMTINRITFDGNDRKDTIYFSNRTKQGELHKKTCPLNKQYEGTSEFEKGWQRAGEDSDVDVAFASDNMFGIKRKTSKETPSKKSSMYTHSGQKQRQYRTTLLGISSKLILSGYKDYVNNRKEHPQSLDDFIRYLYGYSNQIAIHNPKAKMNKAPLHNIWASNENKKNFKKGEFLFVMSEFKKSEEHDFKEDTINVFGQSPYKNAKFNILLGQVKREDYIDALRSNRHIHTNQKNGGKVLVVGIIKKIITKTGSQYFEFVSFDFVNTTKTGLWVESGYETLAFHKAIDEKRLFFKPIISPSFYGDYIPDMEFIDRLHPDRRYIGEVFGIQSNKEYLDTMEKKIALSKITDKFDQWHWKAFEGNDIPPFYPD